MASTASRVILSIRFLLVFLGIFKESTKTVTFGCDCAAAHAGVSLDRRLTRDLVVRRPPPRRRPLDDDMM
jgi:hypothetical protein